MKQLLKETRDLLVMCTLIDKSNQCQEMVKKIDMELQENIPIIQLHIFNEEKKFRISLPIRANEAQEIQDQLNKLDESRTINAKIWITGGIVSKASYESEKRYDEQSKSTK